VVRALPDSIRTPETTRLGILADTLAVRVLASLNPDAP
jgi:hypothetical protein